MDTRPARQDFFASIKTAQGLDTDFIGKNIEGINRLLFCGHRGCGKSTELMRFTRDLNQKNPLYTIYFDLSRGGDPSLSSFDFPDLFLEAATASCGGLMMITSK